MNGYVKAVLRLDEVRRKREERYDRHVRPRINLILYHGVLAPHCRWRAHVVAYRGAAASEAPVGASIRPAANDESTTAPVARYWAWADLMRRAFDIDVLACPRCGGRLRLIATVEDPDAIRAILVALAESRELTGRAPPFRTGVQCRSRDDDRGLSVHPDAAFADLCPLVSWGSIPWCNAAVTQAEELLTGLLSALYWEAEGEPATGRAPIGGGGRRC